ncbi:MAG: low molecular weight protein-tyrosine-phosphatase [Bacteroidota bacterium]
MQKIKVLFVCLGNICRSPMAEGIFEDLVEKEGVADRFEIDSAGTSGYHVGELPDARGRRVCSENGITLQSRSRQFVKQDLSDFDYVLAMDRSNHRNINNLKTPGANYKAVVSLMRAYDPQPDSHDVPDPYYGGDSGFQNVFDMLERSNAALLKEIREKYGF